MDFHSLSRRELQTLCKKNGIPANITNVAMANALEALQTVEGIEEIKETSQFQSPVKAKVKSPNPPRTSRRTSARRAPVPDEAKQQQGSPLPGARRVAIKASEIMKLVSEGEEEKKGGPEEIPVTPAVRTGRKPQAAPSTRRRTSKKEEKEPQEDEQKQEDGLKEIPKTPAASTARNTRRRANKTEETGGHEGLPLEAAITPATRYSLRASTRRGVEAPMVGQEMQEEAVGLRTTRRTGRYINKQLEETAMEAAPNVVRRTARAKAAVKTVVLAQEEDEEQDIAPKNSIDQNNDPVRIPGEKPDEVLMEEDVKNGTISDRDSEVNDDGPNGLQDSSTDETDDGANKETKNSAPMGKNLGTEAAGESPIKGLVTSEPNQETNQEEEEPIDGTLEENPTVTDGRSEEERRGADNLDLALPDPSHSDDIPANGEDSGHHLPETQAAGVPSLVQENLVVELHSEIKAIGDQILEDLIQSKEEEASLSPIGKSLEEDSSDEPPVDQAPEAETSTDLQANLETGDAPVELPYEIPTAETDDSGNSFEAPEDTEELGAGILIGNQMAPEADFSIDLQSNLDTGDAPAELTYQIAAAETDTSGDGIEIPEDTEESSTGIPIGNQMAPEPESVLEAAASSPLQQSPSTVVIVQCPDATGSPAKVLALDENQIGGLAAKTSTQVCDLIGKPVDSGIGSPAVKTLCQVGDPIGCPPESGMESLAKTAVELGDPAGDFADSDLGTGAPVDGIVLEVEGGEKESAAGKESAAVDIYMPESGDGDDNKETLPKGLTVLGGGEAKVKSKAEKPSLPDYSSLSMRKLKALLKEKVEGKRTALSELNDNRV